MWINIQEKMKNKLLSPDAFYYSLHSPLDCCSYCHKGKTALQRIKGHAYVCIIIIIVVTSILLY